MKALSEKLLGGTQGAIALAILATVLLIILPIWLDSFRLSMLGKYVTYAFVSVSLVLLWGNGGILSLGQGIFFGLGGYCMAMFLKLEASDPISTKIQTTPGIPDFMDWNQITALPWFWEPFKSLPLTLILILLIPTLLAFIIGFAMFKRRVGGVYFSIITQAIALILSILIVGQQGYTGGVNGITDLKTLLGWDIRTESAKYVLYYVNVTLLILSIMLGRYIITSKFGMLLLAMRDKEERVRFSGYDCGAVFTAFHDGFIGFHIVFAGVAVPLSMAGKALCLYERHHVFGEGYLFVRRRDGGGEN